MICPLCETEFKGNQWHGGEFKGPFRICPKCDHRFKEPSKPRKPSAREKFLLAELDRLTAQLKEARDALTWYADKSNYGTRVCDDGDGYYDVMYSEAELDCGVLAKAALAATEPKE